MKLSVDKTQRLAKMRAHTATHLLHAQICKFLPNTKQLWSLVDEDLVRFDFASDNMLNEDQIITIEKNINSIIKSDHIINIYEKNIIDAKAMWAKAFFEDKYGDIVRVVCIEKDVRRFDQKMSEDWKPLYLIFDFDGVLGDTYSHSIAWHQFVTNKDYTSAKKRLDNYTNNIPFHAKWHSMTKEQELSQNLSMVNFGKYMNDANIKLFEQFVKDVIKIPNAKIAIVSSWNKSYIIKSLGKYAKYFEYIYDYIDSSSKEDKVDMVCKNRWIDKKHIYYFTDTLADIYELETFVDKSQLIWCAWWFSGLANLSKELPAEQIILEQDWLPAFMNTYIYQQDNLTSKSSEISNDQFLSIELCWWTHVGSTSQIGIFKIIWQQSVASGTKRITAYTWPKVLEYIYDQDSLLHIISHKLNCEPKQAPEKLEKIIKDLAIANSQIESYKSWAAANISWTTKNFWNYPCRTYILGDNLTLKDISNYLKWKNGEYAWEYIYADKDWWFVIYSWWRYAKNIQHELRVSWWWNDQMIQWKDESILEKLG